MARGGDLWLQQFVCKEDPPRAPEDDDRHSSFEPRRLRFLHLRASKSLDEMSRLRKLTSLTYLSEKFRDVFHREHRDTIVCDEDEESPANTRNIYDIIRRNELARAQTTGGFDLAKFGGTVPAARPVAFSKSVSLPEQSHAPSKDQRWCTNCSKCFQRGLSKYDQYCGLDCKTAHRLRQSA